MSAALIADRRLCLTADRSRVVEEADPAAAFLLAAAGGTISQEDTDRYGLSASSGGVVQLASAEPAEPAKKAKEPEKAKPAEKPAGKKGSDA